ncbi:MAG: GH1 family beta-glucosidase [Candidatus Dormibacteria bacterium]
MKLHFPQSFVWGTATAAYQIEGSPLADGAGMSTWHRFSHTPSATRNWENGDVACDHYNRYREDVALMTELNLKAYRLSVAWGRILPEGFGQVNQAGLDFYSRVVDELLAHEITPYITLYHWDLPGALQDAGGWSNRNTAEHFAEYAAVVFKALGDRVSNWITLNEPFVQAMAGNLTAYHAPGVRDLWTAMRVTHHQLLGHGLAVQACRAEKAGQIGITNCYGPQHPASDTPEDIDAARRSWAYSNELFLDPIVKGAYPAVLEEQLAHCWPPVLDGDMHTIAEPVDFLGVNYYTTTLVRDAPGNGLLNLESLPPRGTPTLMNWEVNPDGLHELLVWMKDHCPGIPLYVTENGCSYEDRVEVDGSINDEGRLDYVRRHLVAAHRAISDGVDLRGYFLWSFIDNFEWAMGYEQKFGIVHCNFETQQRTIKNSGRWYGEVALTNCMHVPEAMTSLIT